jgi:hypothetical protein
MALSTQPNGSSVVPLAGTPRLVAGNPAYTLTSQSQVTLIQNVNGAALTETETVKVINN